jgi:hypothetical protein
LTSSPFCPPSHDETGDVDAAQSRIDGTAARQVDFYSTTKKTANPVDGLKRASIRRQATTASARRGVHASRERAAARGGEKRSVQESSMKQGFPDACNMIAQARERTLAATFSRAVRAMLLENLRC